MKVLRLLGCLQALSLLLIHNVAAEDTSVEAPTSTEDYAPPEGAETFAFEAEVNRMLDIVVNSLYQNKDVFLRELISNAADALDKYRYLSLTEPDTYKSANDSDDELQISLEYDAVDQTLTIRDTGIGMTKEDLIENLGTVARSGTTKFVQALKESGSNKEATIEQIGQFGVGFYSSFLVSDRVTVASRHPTAPQQFVWESANGASDFAIFEDPRGNTLNRGTEITLHLRDDAKEYLNPSKLRSLATHYSEFVTHPIRLRTTSTMEVEVEDDEEEEKKEETKEEDVDDLDGEKADEELKVEDEEEAEKPKKMKEVTTHSWDVLNNNKALWTRDKDEITDEEYQGFFHILTDNEKHNATTWSHFNAEGNINFKSLLYLPTEIPKTYETSGNIEQIKGAVRLYVRRVLIGDEFELLPKYLSFVTGIVDSDELPLNVNRETLQENKILKVISKKLTRKALDLIRDFAKKSADEASGKKADEDAEAEISPDGDVDVKEDKEEEDDEEEKVDQYLEWYDKFGTNIKLGCIEDEPNRGKLMKLVRFQTSMSDGKLVSLADYVSRMKDWQKDIFVLGGTSLDEIQASPFLETFADKGVEVVYLTEAIDEYMIRHVRDFDGKKFTDVSSESVKLDDEDDEDLVKRREKAYQKKYKSLLQWMKTLFLKARILRVQISKRSLGSMPAVVSSTDFGNSANMERIMKAQTFHSQENEMMMMAMKVLDLNPRHPLVVKLAEQMPEGDDDMKDFEADEATLDAAWMLFDMATLNGGFPIADPAGHNQRLLRVLQSKYALESLKLEPEIDPPVEDDEPPEPEDGMDGLNMADFGDLGDFDVGDMADLDLDL